MEIQIENAPDDVQPKCPHCQQPLDRIWVWKKGLGVLEQKQIIMCPHCESFLGYGVFGAR